jgi:hypothetical protein
MKLSIEGKQLKYSSFKKSTEIPIKDPGRLNGR